MTSIWKQIRKSFPKKILPLPTGVKNVFGKVIINQEEKKQVILEHFRHTMRKRPAQEEVKSVIKSIEALYKKRILSAQSVKSPPFRMTNLETILKSLMVGKSRYPEDMVCEIFKDGVIVIDLKESILMMFNKMKQQTTFPECMKTATITTLHEKKCKLDMNTWRGSFVTSELKAFLIKLLHVRTYQKVAHVMSDSQIVAQKKCEKSFICFKFQNK